MAAMAFEDAQLPQESMLATLSSQFAGSMWMLPFSTAEPNIGDVAEPNIGNLDCPQLAATRPAVTTVSVAPVFWPPRPYTSIEHAVRWHPLPSYCEYHKVNVTISGCGRLFGKKDRILSHIRSPPLRAPGVSEVTSHLDNTPPDAHVSDSSSLASSAGDSPRSEPAQCWSRLLQDTLPHTATQYSLSNEHSAPESRMQAPAARIIPEVSPILTHINPKRGPKSGGDDVCLIVENLPPTAVVYARFGGNIAPTSHIANGVLACRLPAAVHSGAVDVTLCQTPSVHGERYGKSLVSFKYECNTIAAATLLRKLHGGTLSTEGLLDRIVQEPTAKANSGSNHSATRHPSSLPESVFLEVLNNIKGLADFQDRISTVNEYCQSLLHLAVHLQYRELAQSLVDWGIDINIKDVNGFTALHTAYLCGDAPIIQTLEQHGAIQLSLDKLGRPPIELRICCVTGREFHIGLSGSDAGSDGHTQGFADKCNKCSLDEAGSV